MTYIEQHKHVSVLLLSGINVYRQLHAQKGLIIKTFFLLKKKKKKKKKVFHLSNNVLMQTLKKTLIVKLLHLTFF